MKGKVIIVVVLFALLFFIFYISSSSSNIDVEYDGDRQVRNSIRSEDPFMPEGWTGIKISRDNPLFVDPKEDEKRYHAGYLSLKKILLLMDRDDWFDAEISWENLLTKYEKIIGWNGMFDVIDDVQKILKFEAVSRLHSLGENLYSHAPRAKYAVEISSRNMLHKAALHGSVWQAIAAFGTSDLDALFKFIDEELCFFKSEKDMGNIWISCNYKNYNL